MATKIPNEAYNYQMEFPNFKDWLIAFKSPSAIWNETPTHLVIEIMLYLGTLSCLTHAIRRGGRWPIIFLAPIGHGLFVEVLSYNIPDIDSFWHSQSMIMLAGRRLPLHNALLYTVFYYHAFWAASKLKFKCQWMEHIAVGLLALLLDIPYDMTGVRFVNWTWHDTDPNLFDRNYFVPITSYMFHVTFATSMSILLHNVRRLFEKKRTDKWERGSLVSEVITVLSMSVLSMPLGTLIFMVSYHVLHDYLLIPTQAALFPLFAILFVVVWRADRKNVPRVGEEENDTRANSVADKVPFFYLVVHYVTFTVIHMVFNPEEHFSTSFHETIGDCSKTETVRTLLKDLQKRAFLCVTDYDEKYFDFKCLKEMPPSGSRWYTVCGTPYENRAEYIWIMTAVTVIALTIFSSIHCSKTYCENNSQLTKKDKKVKIK